MPRALKALACLAALACFLGTSGLAVAQAGDADPAALQMFSSDDSGSAMCGSDRVTWNNQRSFDINISGSATLQVLTSGGRLLLDLSRPLAAGEKLIPLWCGDVLGNGSQALGFETFSGGAHCCFSATVVALEPGGRHLLDASLGNGGLIQPQQLDNGGALELPATSDVFAYFDHLSFAASPFMPLIFAYDGSRYVEATRQFPDTINSEIDRAEADLSDALARGIPADTPPELAYQGQDSVALRLYGLHVLRGDAQQALPSIRRRVAPEVAAWLDANAAEAADAMAQVYSLGDESEPGK